MSRYREILEEYLSKLNIATEKVLDVGGASNPIKDRVNSWAVDNYAIADNGLEKGEYEFKFDLNGDDCEWWECDIVFCLEVMEYIYNPVKAMENLSATTKKGGTLYITFPTLYPVHNPYKFDYLRYTKEGAIVLLQKAGFDVEEIVARKIYDAKLYDKHVKAEGYRAKGATKSGTLFDAGYIIKAKKI